MSSIDYIPLWMTQPIGDIHVAMHLRVCNNSNHSIYQWHHTPSHSAESLLLFYFWLVNVPIQCLFQQSKLANNEFKFSWWVFHSLMDPLVNLWHRWQGNIYVMLKTLDEIQWMTFWFFMHKSQGQIHVMFKILDEIQWMTSVSDLKNLGLLRESNRKHFLSALCIHMESQGSCFFSSSS